MNEKALLGVGLLGVGAIGFDVLGSLRTGLVLVWRVHFTRVLCVGLARIPALPSESVTPHSGLRKSDFCDNAARQGELRLSGGF